MSRPKVLIVGRTRYRLPLAPGLARKFDALARELDWSVLASDAGGSTFDPRFELARRFPVGALDGLAHHLRLPFRVRRAIRRFRPDVIVAEDPFAAAAVLIARQLVRGSRPRVVAEVHGNWRLATRLYGSMGRRLIAPLADAVARIALVRADATRALSAYTAGLAEEVGARPAAAFPTYSDLGTFTAQPPLALPERPTAVFVGALERYKNVDGLAAAWPRVLEHVPEARLVVIGRGSLRALVERLASGRPSVEYIEELSPDGVAAGLDAATVLVLVSRFEGLGRVVVEAFARGRGVVAARAGGILDLVDDGVEGLLVDPEDVDAIADALVRVLSDRALAERLGAAAHQRFGALNASPDEFAARMRQLVDAAMAR